MIDDPIEDNPVGYKIVRKATTKTFEQIIQLEGQEQLIPVLARMASVMRIGKFTGTTTINWNQGGVHNICTKEIEQ